MNFDEGAEARLEDERKELSREKANLSKEVDKFEAT